MEKELYYTNNKLISKLKDKYLISYTYLILPMSNFILANVHISFAITNA